MWSVVVFIAAKKLKGEDNDSVSLNNEDSIDSSGNQIVIFTIMMWC